jgi:hypothetical protein
VELLVRVLTKVPWVPACDHVPLVHTNDTEVMITIAAAARATREGMWTPL